MPNDEQLQLKRWLDEAADSGELSSDEEHAARLISQKLTKGLPLTDEELVDVESIVGPDKLSTLAD